MLFHKIDKIITNLSKKLFFTISTIIQFAFAFALIYISLQLFINYNDANKKITNSFGENQLFSIQNNEDYAKKLYKKNNIDDYNNFYNYINKNYKIINMLEDNFFVTDFDNIENFVIPNTPVTNVGEDNYYILNSLTVNNNYFENFNIKLSNGRNFNYDDYNPKDNASEVPIILGNDYSEIFKINDKIHFYDSYSNSKKTGTIIGFLEKGQFYIKKPVAIENIVSLDKTVLIPSQPIKENNQDIINNKLTNLNNLKLYLQITNSYFVDLNDSDILNLKEQSTKFNFFDISIVSMDDSISIFKEIFKQQQIIYISILILILLISSISMITNIINSINDRKREFGIYFAMGATKKYIIDLVVYEIFILIFSAALLSTLIIKYFNPSDINIFDINTYGLMCVIVLIISMLISLIPLLKIKNTPMSSLLREE